MDITSQKEFKSLLKQKGFKYREANQGWIRISCPTCSSRDSAKMKRYVHPSMYGSHCFICEEHIPLNELLSEEIKYTGSIIIEEEYEHPQARELPIEQGVIPINKLPLDHPAIKFLQKDHFSNFDELYENFLVYYIPDGCAKGVKFDSGAVIYPGDSLLFPVFQKDILVGWQCRFIPGTVNGDKFNKMKYFMCFNKGKYLYNFDRARESPFVVVFEGVKKTWKYSTAGVATLGKGITTDQIQLLQNNWKKIVFFLDGEEEAQEAASQYYAILQMNGRECVNINPAQYGFHSPDEMTHEEIKQIIASKIC